MTSPEIEYQKENDEMMIKLRLVEIFAKRSDFPPDKILETVNPLAEWILKKIDNK